MVWLPTVHISVCLIVFYSCSSRHDTRCFSPSSSEIRACFFAVSMFLFVCFSSVVRAPPPLPSPGGTPFSSFFFSLKMHHHIILANIIEGRGAHLRFGRPGWARMGTSVGKRREGEGRREAVGGVGGVPEGVLGNGRGELCGKLLPCVLQHVGTVSKYTCSTTTVGGVIRPCMRWLVCVCGV